jgi:hypothetical protein
MGILVVMEHEGSNSDEQFSRVRVFFFVLF